MTHGQHRPRGAIDAAIDAAKAETKRPSLIVVKTTIGFGSPNKAGKSSAHGSPLGAEEVALTKKALGCRPGEEVLRAARGAGAVPHGASTRGKAARRPSGRRASPRTRRRTPSWRRSSSAPRRRAARGLRRGAARRSRRARRWRRASPAGKALSALALKVPELFGGDADLGGSTKTALKDAGLLRGADRQRPQHPLRRSRARHGGHRQRHRLPRRPAALHRDVLLLHRLHAAGGAAGGAERPAGGARVDARLDRPRRGRARRTSRSST